MKFFEVRAKKFLTSRGILEFILEKSYNELKEKNEELGKYFKATTYAKYLDQNANKNYTGNTCHYILLHILLVTQIQ